MQYPIASNDSNDDNERILSGNWIENEEIKQLLKQYLSAVKNNNKNDFDMLSRKETLLEYQLQNDRSIHRSELLFDTQKLEIISSLCTSLVRCILTLVLHFDTCIIRTGLWDS